MAYYFTDSGCTEYPGEFGYEDALNQHLEFTEMLTDPVNYYTPTLGVPVSVFSDLYLDVGFAWAEVNIEWGDPFDAVSGSFIIYECEPGGGSSGLLADAEWSDFYDLWGAAAVVLALAYGARMAKRVLG